MKTETGQSVFLKIKKLTVFGQTLYNYIGMAQSAIPGDDEYDMPEIPVMGDYVSVAFDHATEGGAVEPYTLTINPIQPTGILGT